MKGLKRKREAGEDEDRLSTLPEGVLIQILCFLDTKFAVQTSLLSKRWVNLWTSLPDLNLDSTVFRKYSSFDKFVNKVLSLRSSLVRINNLNFTRKFNSDAPFLEKVTNYAVAHSVQQLSISLECPANFGFLACLCTSDSLKTLKLKSKSFLKFPRETPCFRQLITLHLERAILVKSDAFSGCPNLVNLTLSDCFLSPFPVLNLIAPLLLSLTILAPHPRGCEYRPRSPYPKILLSTPRLTSFKFEGIFPPLLQTDELPLLDTMFMVVCDLSREVSLKFHSDLINTMQCVRNAKSLTLSSSIVKLLGLVPDKLAQEPSPFGNLRFLNLILSESLESFKIPAHVTTYLLKSSPRAEVVMEFPRCTCKHKRGCRTSRLRH